MKDLYRSSQSIFTIVKKNLDFNDLNFTRIKDLGGSSQNTFNLIDFDDLKSTSMKDLGSFTMVEENFAF